MDNESGESWRGPARGLAPGRFVELPGRGPTFVRERAGPPEAPVVVLLHGWTATAALNWHTSFELLARHFRVIAPDLRGHGRGLRSPEPFRLEDCADDVAALLGVLGVERALLVGYSMGGPIAQLVARRHPQLIDGLVLCATSRAFNRRPRERLVFGASRCGAAVASTGAGRSLAAAAAAVARGWRRRTPAWGADELARHDWAQLLEAGRQLGRFDSRPWVGELSTPTAVIATSDDDIVPHHRQLGLAAAIPDARLAVVDGGHSVCTTAPERFVPVLVRVCRDLARLADHRAVHAA